MVVSADWQDEGTTGRLETRPGITPGNESAGRGVGMAVTNQHDSTAEPQHGIHAPDAPVQGEMTMTTALAQSTALTASDRCDRCGAQAFVRVVLMAGGDLLFCSHHFNEHADKLRPQAAEIIDESHKLTEAPAQ